MKLKKISLIFLLTLIMVLQGAVLGLTAFANGPSLAVGHTTGAPGSVIEVPVNLTSSGEVIAMQFDLSYDPSLLVYQQTSKGSLTSNFSVSSNNIDGNKVRVIIYNEDNTPVAAGSGTVAQLQFQVAAATSAKQTCTLGLSGVILADIQRQAISSTSNNGQFTVLKSSSSNGSSRRNGPTTPQPVNSTNGEAYVSPETGGKISLGTDVSVNIPAGALKGTAKEYITIQKVSSPQNIPPGFKLLGSVYEFKVGSSTSYSFNKPVTLTFTFDAASLSPGETPAVYYYDKTAGKWVNIGGVVSGNTITVQVNHFTKFAVLAAVKQVGTLNDIDGHWAADNIRKLVTLGAISGYPDGSFKPNNNITRAEFATILVKAFKLTASGEKIFADTSKHWAKDSIATAAAAGIVKGYDADTFGPNDLITREQMAAMIVNAAKLSPVTEEMKFADGSSISNWARAAMATAVKNGIMNGYPDNTLRPRGNATRAEAVTVIVNALQ